MTYAVDMLAMLAFALPMVGPVKYAYRKYAYAEVGS